MFFSETYEKEILLLMKFKDISYVYTSWTVVESIKAATGKLNLNLSGLTAIIQGFGKVGSECVKLLSGMLAMKVDLNFNNLRIRHVKSRTKGYLRRIRTLKPITNLCGYKYFRSLTKIEIDITYACNLKCPNCNRSVSQSPSVDHMSLDQIKKFVEESSEKSWRWESIKLLGGEPTLHPQFFQILETLIQYKRQCTHEVRIQVVTNGHGNFVQSRLGNIPEEIEIRNTSKKFSETTPFVPFNMAPIDSDKFKNVDYRNGCEITSISGMGLSPYGYYHCAVAAGIDRVFGFNKGRKQLPEQTDDMRDLFDAFCRYCGHFGKGFGYDYHFITEGKISQTWNEAYKKYKEKRGSLTRY